MKTPHLIAAYPRSGSTWLRFILCNLFYPNQEHDIHSVNCLSPSIDDWSGLWHGHPYQPQFFKTHSLHHGRGIIHVYRHVGDVLISEHHYKLKYEDRKEWFIEQLIKDDFGSNWRRTVDHYLHNHAFKIRYEDMGQVKTVKALVEKIAPGKFSATQIQEAMDKSSFERLQKVEEKGFGIYPTGKTNIKFFREGRSDQWKELEPKLQQRIRDKNINQLQALGYT